MHGNHHRDCTRRACQVVGLLPDIAALLEEWVTFPDRVHDVYLDPAGRSFRFDDYYTVGGNNLACLNHFERVEGKEAQPGHGYRRADDPSASWVDLPNVPIGVSVLEWKRALSSSGWAATHPALKLVGKALDEIEYIPSHGMVSWFETRMTKWNCSTVNKCKAMAGQFHMLQDACMDPHAKAYLLSGHSTWESKSYDGWISMNKSHILQRTPSDSWTGSTEDAVISAAHHAVDCTPEAGALQGYVYTVLVLRGLSSRNPWMVK